LDSSSFEIHGGIFICGTVDANRSVIRLHGNWIDSGKFTPKASTVVFVDTLPQLIAHSASESFDNLTIDKPRNGVRLGANIHVDGILTIASGYLDLFGDTITLGPSAFLSESPGQTVRGSSGIITTTRSLDHPDSVNVAGMGAILSSGANLGATKVGRGHAEQHDTSWCRSILRYFDILPANNTGLDATLAFRYDTCELNSIHEPLLTLFSSSDAGVSWVGGNGLLDTAKNLIVQTHISSFRRWTAASADAPLRVAIDPQIASALLLHGIYPNPFRATTMIEYSVGTEAVVRIHVFDLFGRSVAVLVDGRVCPGRYSIRSDLSRLPAGGYLCVMETKKCRIARMIVKLE
jgi:hypothetical protein